MHSAPQLRSPPHLRIAPAHVMIYLSPVVHVRQATPGHQGDYGYWPGIPRHARWWCSSLVERGVNERSKWKIDPTLNYQRSILKDGRLCMGCTTITQCLVRCYWTGYPGSWQSWKPWRPRFNVGDAKWDRLLCSRDGREPSLLRVRRQSDPSLPNPPDHQESIKGPRHCGPIDAPREVGDRRDSSAQGPSRG